MRVIKFVQLKIRENCSKRKQKHYQVYIPEMNIYFYRVQIPFKGIQKKVQLCTIINKLKNEEENRKVDQNLDPKRKDQKT